MNEAPSPTAQAAEKLLQSLIGDWEGTNNTWFQPDVLADSSPIHATIRPLSGSSYVIHEYHSTMDGQPFHGIAMLAFNAQAEQFEIAWIDSFHMSTNIMMSSGDWQPDLLSVLGKYSVPGSEEWGWRTEYRLLDDDHLTVTAYNVLPDGLEAKGVEATYHRKGARA